MLRLSEIYMCQTKAVLSIRNLFFCAFFSVFAYPMTGNAYVTPSMNDCLSCTCTSVTNCSFSLKGGDSCQTQSGLVDLCRSESAYCTAAEVRNKCPDGTSPKGCNKIIEGCGCAEWDCENGNSGSKVCGKGTDKLSACVDCLNLTNTGTCCMPKTVTSSCNKEVYNVRYDDDISDGVYTCIKDRLKVANVSCATGYYAPDGITYSVDYDLDVYGCKGCVKCDEGAKLNICADNEKATKIVDAFGDEYYRTNGNACDTTASYPGVSGSITENPERFMRRSYTYVDKNSCVFKWQDTWMCAPGYYMNGALSGAAPAFICEPCPTGTYLDNGNECKYCGKYKTTFLDNNNDGVIDEYTDANFTAAACKICPLGYQLKGYECVACAENEYGIVAYDGNEKINYYKCSRCDLIDERTIDDPVPFTSDDPSVTGKLNTSINDCYIRLNVKLTDELGTISLIDEIGKKTKLYYQGK